MTDIKALLLKATAYMQRSDPAFAAQLEAAAESLAADCGCAASDIGQSGHSCRSQGAGATRRCAECDCLLPRVCTSCSGGSVRELEAKLAAAEDKLKTAYIDGWLDGVLGECEDFEESWPISDTKSAIDAARGEV